MQRMLVAVSINNQNDLASPSTIEGPEIPPANIDSVIIFKFALARLSVWQKIHLSSRIG